MYSRKQLEAFGEPFGDSCTRIEGCRIIYGGGGKSSPPPAPDYTGAAVATAAGNLDATRAAADANRVNQYTPYGSLTYSHDPNAATPDQGWSQTVDLSPTGQKLLDYSNNAALGLGQQTDQALSRVDQGLSQPFDYGSVQDTQDAAYKSYTSRLDPQWSAASKAKETELANQGIPVGSEAYTNAMRDFNNAKNDAYSQASVNAINTAPQTYQLAQALRSQPLNELNALRTGSQVTNPTFTPVAQQATTAGPDYLGAANATYGANLGNYNAQTAQSNALTGGLFSLGAAALTNPSTYTMFSDRRLKSRIKRLGTHRGLGVYSYDIFGKHEIGVMAQEVLEVRPEAVMKHPSGYLMVDYGRL